jgi:predicted secreted protein
MMNRFRIIKYTLMMVCIMGVLCYASTVVCALHSDEQSSEQTVVIRDLKSHSSAGERSEDAESISGQQDEQLNFERTIGQKIVINVPANLSTGYSWYWLIDDSFKEMPVVLTDKEYIPSQEARAGQAGVMRFTFKAVRRGQMTITMYNKRLWQQNSDIGMRQYKITVK